MKKPLKILFAAAEAAPLAKVGGLADVAGALPKALAELGTDVRLVLPFYGSIDGKKYKIKKLSGNLWQTVLPQSRVPVYLIKHELFRDRHIYHSSLADSARDINKFLTFSGLILPALKIADFSPNIIHLNDWHVAALAQSARRRGVKTVFTIHNLASQGILPGRNLMAEGITNADAVTTVSPTYAREILTKQYGCGLEKILRQRKKDLYGILNGLDTDFFNSQTDEFIGSNYSSRSIERKQADKSALIKKLGWPNDKNLALAGLITRLVGQKGVDLLSDRFADLNCRFVFLGTGDKQYENALLGLSKRHPDKFKTLIKFDEALAHQIYAAADIFLVPSRFEPCGLTQLIAMRYGTVPIVHATGGLADTVNDRIGFNFKKFSAGELYDSLNRALKIYYHEPKIWRRLQLNGMRQDFSWNKPAQAYLTLYKKLLADNLKSHSH